MDLLAVSASEPVNSLLLAVTSSVPYLPTVDASHLHTLDFLLLFLAELYDMSKLCEVIDPLARKTIQVYMGIAALYLSSYCILVHRGP